MFPGIAPIGRCCGLLKDRFGLSWQIVPSAMPAMMTAPDLPRVVPRVTRALLAMSRLDIASVERAYGGA